MKKSTLTEMACTGIDLLRQEDPQLYQLLELENQRQNEVLAMVAASSVADPSVLACNGSATVNVTTEGYPGARFHAGCVHIDEIERLAVSRAKAAFRAQYANVQPHSGSSANAVVIFSLLKAGETILGLDLDSGGHLTHGSKASVSGQYFNAVGYGLTAQGLIDYDQVHTLAKQHRPKLIICGASAYPRTIDFKRFRAIADDVGAYLLADISHIAGLVVAGVHPSPIDHAHFTTTSTYKQLYGPRGGLILMGKDHEALAPDGKKTLTQMVQRGVFPYFQGTPDLAAIASKARALDWVMKPGFKTIAQCIVDDARKLSELVTEQGYRVLTGGTDNHIVLIDVLSTCNITGVIAEKALEECNIVINKNRIPGDKKSALVASGARLGTNSLALRGMGPAVMPECADLMHRVLSAVKAEDDHRYTLDDEIKRSCREQVKSLCQRYPLPHYGSGVAHTRSEQSDSKLASE